MRSAPWAHIGHVGPAIAAEGLRAFASAARRNLRNDDGMFARQHLRLIAQRVEVVSMSEVSILDIITADTITNYVADLPDGKEGFNQPAYAMDRDSRKAFARFLKGSGENETPRR